MCLRKSHMPHSPGKTSQHLQPTVLHPMLQSFQKVLWKDGL